MSTNLAHLPDKLCTACMVSKSRAEFSERRQRAGCVDAYWASNAYCKACEAQKARNRYHANLDEAAARNRRANLKRLYGLSPEQFTEMLRMQGGGCAICGTGEPGGLGQFHVDHCHHTGRVRGLLCLNCNRGLGALKDDAGLLRRAIAYLNAGDGE